MGKISVVIVTYNRPKDVIETIESILHQSCKPLEIIVIDDCSNPQLNLKFAIENLRLIRFNKEAGLSSARNFGVKIAKGDYIAFIDDDAIANKHWLEEIQKGIERGADILGGPLEPIYEVPPPRWWDEKLFGGYVGIGNIRKKYIYGANMVISKEVFRRIGLFQPTIGRQKGKLLSYEEWDLFERAKRAGFSVLFMARAIVYHKVKRHRMTLKYLLKWAYYNGKSTKVLNRHRPLIMLAIIKATFNIMHPRVIFSPKSFKIKKITTVVYLFGQLFSGITK
ncbi:MAG: glycosyltransferase family 2 protein [Candidatus Bathyarchaeia archaeon]